MKRLAFAVFVLVALAACGGDDSGVGISRGTDTAGTATLPATTAKRTTTTRRTTTTEKPKTRIEKAVAACLDSEKPNADQRRYLEDAVGDGGATISLDTPGDDDYGIGNDYSIVTCILNEFEVTDFVLDQIGQTRALDGTRDAEWNDFQAFWTYHPDNGLAISIHDTKED